MKKIYLILPAICFFCTSPAFSKSYYYVSTGFGLTVASFSGGAKDSLYYLEKNLNANEITPPQFAIQGAVGHRTFFGNRDDYFYDLELFGQYDSLRLKKFNSHGYAIGAYGAGAIGRYIAPKLLARVGFGIGAGTWTVPGGLIYENHDMVAFDMTYRASVGIEYEINKDINLYAEYGFGILPGFDKHIDISDNQNQNYDIKNMGAHSLLFGVRYKISFK